MSRSLLAVLGAAVLLSGCSAGTTTTTKTAPVSGAIRLSTGAFSGQLPSPCPLPNGTLGTAYSVSITASGGIRPFQWSLALGSLPPGLALASAASSATISGTPQQSGNFNFTLQVMDAEVPPVIAVAEFTLTVDNPVPVIASISPASAPAGGAAFTLTVNGSNFISGATVDWNGVARATTFVSGTQLTAAILASDIATGGTAQITVVNPSPGGGTSNAVVFTVDNPVPVIASISPSSASAGGAAFTLTVNGSNFVSGATVDWNGVAHATTFVSGTQLTAAILASDIAIGSTVQITVVNPSPGGGPSNAVVFTINNPVPVIASLSPASATAGGAAFTLTVNGSNFVSGAMVEWNGLSRATTFVSGTQLTAAILATDIATGSTSQITVVNPSPGGGTSNAVVFTVNNPVPVIASLSPSSAIAYGAAFTLTVNGSSFVSTATVDWNGSARATTFISPTQLTAAILASDITAAGAVNVTVVNPSPAGGTSNAAAFTIRSFPQIVSVATDGTQGNTYSGTEGRVATSSDGRFVAFESDASNLVAGDTNQATDVFLRDTCQTIAGPVSGCTPSTTLVSVSTTGTVGNGLSQSPSISSDGRFVAFSSYATNLVPAVVGTSVSAGVFVRDTCQTTTGPVSGCTPLTTLVSVASDGTPGNGFSELPSISANGRFVAFDSYATNLVAVDANQGNDVFVHDTCQTSSGPVSGCTPSTALVSVASDGTQGNSDSADASISADGRFIAFDSYATNLVAGDTNNVEDVFVHDTCAGAASACTPSTVRVSVASDGTQGNFLPGSDFNGSSRPSISADGRFVAFQSYSTNLVANDINNFGDVFVHDTCQTSTGPVSGCALSTTLVSVASDGTQGDSDSADASVSADGRFITFDSYATTLVAGDTNAAEDVFVRDTCAGVASACTPSTIRVSVASDGTQGNGGSYGPAISGDGHFVAFASGASNLVVNDTNGFDDVFLTITTF